MIITRRDVAVILFSDPALCDVEETEPVWAWHAAAHWPVHNWIHNASYTAEHSTVHHSKCCFCCAACAQHNFALPLRQNLDGNIDEIEPDGRNNINFNRNRECCASVTLKTRNSSVSSSFFFLSHPFSLHAITARVSILPPAPCRSIKNNLASIFDPSTGHYNSRHSMSPCTSIASGITHSVP